ncbi:thiamine-phosphate synthase family protein [Halospeciosus flavus]|uniref:Thiamine-phosphate synthase family protein n=1 Tax=Halospeciosus flavus TaxID=3032283 RepID=A0ABD5Z667_9EURY|nr:thiamine-phosphate synthase family protein [Halospeciosus flavus]
MKFVEEVVVEEFLPTFRSMLAEDLRERGLTQQEVAEALGISQSAVSKYAQGAVDRNADLATDERVQDLVERVAEGFDSGSMSSVQALVEAEVLIRRLEAPGDRLATLHEEAMPALADYEADFRIHDPESELRAREHARSSVKRGLRVLEHASGFATLIPNVGSNLVECTPDATDVEDVVGVPGRIFDVMGRTEVPAEPEFGVSEHVASVLLAARDEGADAAAALNVAYDEGLVQQLEDLGYVTVEFDAAYERGEDGGIREAVAEALAREPDATVLYQTGGFGVEPNVYILAASAVDAAEIARDVV